MAEPALQERTQYESVGGHYDTLTRTPMAALEAQFVAAALASFDVRGKTVLDLGGGTGIHARRAIEAGATLVDLVDISPEMVKIAQIEEERLDRKNSIRFFVADATEDLGSLNLGLQAQYDIVMVGWLLDHSRSDEDLEAFWRNISAFTKPGGGCSIIRVANPQSVCVIRNLRYGLEFSDMREIPGGLAYHVYVDVDPPLEFEGTSMKKSYSASLSRAMFEKHGFEQVKIIEPREMEVVKKDPELWKQYLDDPFFCCEVGRKKQ